MHNIFSNFYNIDFKNDVILPNNNDIIISKIKEEIENTKSLNIVKNSKLLKNTINTTLAFSEGKKNFVVFGTGGSNLGAKALIDIKLGNEKKNIIFCDNIDPIKFKNIVDKISIANTGFIIISKSGSTPETLSQFSSIIEIAEQNSLTKTLYKNSLVITEKKESPLYKLSQENYCTILNHEKEIGGRFSVFSNVGMVPAIIAGLDVEQIHAGVLDILNNNNYIECIKLAQYFRYQKNNPILSNNVIFTYSDSLIHFGKWYLQLWAESIGKDGKGVTPIHAIGTTDQHSQLQLYLDGPRDKFFNFITTEHKNKGLKINSKIMQEYKIDYLVNKSMGDLMHAEQEATLDTFKQNNFAIRRLFIPEINEFSIGQLMSLSIIETIATCIYYEVNPFNQPAVEFGKNLTKRYLI